MATFVDNYSRTWTVEITEAGVAAVLAITGGEIDLRRAGGDTSVMRRIAKFPPALANVLFALCKPQCPTMDEAYFWKGIRNAALKRAESALREALAEYQDARANEMGGT